MFKNIVTGACVSAAVAIVVTLGIVSGIRPGATPGGDFYSPVQALAGFVRGNTHATTTAGTAATLALADFAGYDTLTITPNFGATTLTFPASSTLRSFIPKAGMIQETCITNATSTSAATLTFVSGTGIDMEVASSTGPALIASTPIPAGGHACFKFIRQADTDIAALYQSYEDSD